ncbi:unnamed protein product [Didymodactylos carnosus]|uniref:Reactive oxygen species modulator 1 n=1 Tax=Didymodactylos carnosus TaxID=1234261 RepID=A0A814DRM6_9BILA|nr:unnamed protein product [Didymodactylos carnosus]CAF1053700.1 unnamed protein product [Didymodactylos carnosus]CAF3734023.1 unnamed protein product [Didymodactylos carnosus]CAF3820140.1 unnamed protein product [Didymodactylos carnosus]
MRAFYILSGTDVHWCPEKTLFGTVPAGYQQGQGRKVTCFDRIKIGFAMGFTVGMVTGIVFGGFTAIKYGLRGRELVSTVGKSVISAGGTFGTFMAIAGAIRC